MQIIRSVTLFLAFVCLCNFVTADKSESEAYRLPNSVRPEFYKLNVFTNLGDENGFKFHGDVAIKVSKMAGIVWRLLQMPTIRQLFIFFPFFCISEAIHN